MSNPRPSFEVAFSHAPAAPQPLEVAAAAPQSVDPAAELLAQQLAQAEFATGFALVDDCPSVDPRSTPRPARIARHEWRTSNGRSEKVERKLLGVSDVPWLQPLVAGQILELEWFEAANELAAVGSQNMQGLGRYKAAAAAEIAEARHVLWEEYFGWADPDSPLFKPYAAYKKQKPNLRPSGPMLNNLRQLPKSVSDPVATLQRDSTTLSESPEHTRHIARMLASYGLNAIRIFDAVPSLKRMAFTTLEDRWHNLEGNGFNAPQIADKDPRVLEIKPDELNPFVEARVRRRGADALRELEAEPGPLMRIRRDKRSPEAIAKRRELVTRVVAEAGFTHADPEQVIKSLSIANLSAANLALTLQIIAKFGDLEMPGGELGRVAICAIESHLLATVSDRPYTNREVRRMGRHMTPEQKRQKVAGLLDDPSFVEKVGPAIIEQYKEYISTRDATETAE